GQATEEAPKGEAAALAGEDRGARESDFEILRWAEADLLSVNERVAGSEVSGDTAEEKLGAHGPELLEDAGKLSGHGARYPRHIHGLGVRAEQHAAVFPSAPPQTLLPYRKTPPGER